MLRSSSVQRRKGEAVETHENGHNCEGERNNPSSSTGAGAPATGGDEAERIDAFIPQLDELITQGLVLAEERAFGVALQNVLGSVVAPALAAAAGLALAAL